jgi:sugar phosphate isomerase/epimerase
MKIGIASGAYMQRYGLEKGAEKMAEHGFECLDVSRFTNTETDFFKLPEAEFEKELVRYGSVLKANGITANQSHSPWRHPAEDFTVEQRAERLEAFKKAIRGSAYLGVTDFVMHPIMPFGTNSPDNPELMRDMNAEFMAALAEESKKYGNIRINVENLPFPKLPLNHPTDIVEHVKRMNREVSGDLFRVCIDTGHCNYCKYSAAESVRLVGDLLGTLHVHDNDSTRDAHATPGNGNIDWEDFSNALREVGFDKVLSFETQVDKDIPIGEERDGMERELFNIGMKIAKRI